MEPIAILQEQKILLLYGGWSAERNISINSGTAVAGALNRNGISFSEYDLTSEEEAKLLSTDYDLAFIALHGRGGEDGFIQEILESKNIKYTGSDTLSCKTSLITTEPSLLALKPFKDPLYVPIGVLMALTITTSFDLLIINFKFNLSLKYTKI